MKTLYKPLIIASLLSLSASAFALTGNQSVMKEKVVTDADGTQHVELVPADLIVPGEKVVYQLNYTNDQAQPATDLVMVMPVPDVVTYIDGTANGADSQIAYSVDGGKSFGPRGSLSVVDSDGQVRTATAEDITHIRWTVAGPVAPGSSGALAFKGVLK